MIKAKYYIATRWINDKLKSICIRNIKNVYGFQTKESKNPKHYDAIKVLNKDCLPEMIA